MYSIVSTRRGKGIEGGVHIGQIIIEGGANRRGGSCRLVFIKRRSNRRGYACRQLFNRKGVLREGGLCW